MSFKSFFSLCVFLTLLISASIHAAPIQTLIESFLAEQTKNLPGTAQIEVEAKNLPACTAPEIFLPNGSRVWGKLSVGVRCSDTPSWSRFVPAYVAVYGNYLITTRPILAGDSLTESDVTFSSGDLTKLPKNLVTDLTQVRGMVASNRIALGAPVRQDFLRGAVRIQAGQQVRIVTQGEGFTAHTEGRALTNGTVGATVQIKTESGKIVNGILSADGQIVVQ